VGQPFPLDKELPLSLAHRYNSRRFSALNPATSLTARYVRPEKKEIPLLMR
jgi:hypothetical protein